MDFIMNVLNIKLKGMIETDISHISNRSMHFESYLPKHIYIFCIAGAELSMLGTSHLSVTVLTMFWPRKGRRYCVSNKTSSKFLPRNMA